MDAISCLAPQSSLLAASLGDAALARALQLSAMSDSASTSSSSSAAGHHHLLQNYSPLLQLCAADLAYMSPPVTCESVLVSPRRSSPQGVGRRRHQQIINHHHHHQLARAGKRRSRASKRTPTTYITTDPTNFRLMVQHITGAQAEPVSPADLSAFDSSSLLLLPADANTLLPAVDHHRPQPQQQPCFPTLDSWNVSCSMYDRNDLL